MGNGRGGQWFRILPAKPKTPNFSVRSIPTIILCGTSKWVGVSLLGLEHLHSTCVVPQNSPSVQLTMHRQLLTLKKTNESVFWQHNDLFSSLAVATSHVDFLLELEPPTCNPVVIKTYLVSLGGYKWGAINRSSVCNWKSPKIPPTFVATFFFLQNLINWNVHHILFWV